MESESFTGEWDDALPESQEGMSELESNLAEADTADRIERRELEGSADEKPPAAAVDRSLEEKVLQQYQEQEKARIPKLLGKIASTELTPRFRQGHRIGGEVGRKGRRGLK